LRHARPDTSGSSRHIAARGGDAIARQEENMTAYNIVRFRVKPGREQQFLDAHRDLKRSFPGFRRGGLIKSGERSYCFVGEWDGMAEIAAARPAMIANLDRFRDTLEDLGNGMGVTDPVSGEVVVDIGA
jgi:hypothetical protein